MMDALVEELHNFVIVLVIWDYLLELTALV